MNDLNALELPELFEALVADGALKRILAAARAEDFGERGDVTTEVIVAPGAAATASGVAREAGVVAGLAAIPGVIGAFGGTARPEAAAADGHACRAGETLFRLQGPLAE